MLLGTTSSVRPGARLCPTRCRRAGPRWCSTLTPVTTRSNDSLIRLLRHRAPSRRTFRRLLEEGWQRTLMIAHEFVRTVMQSLAGVPKCSAARTPEVPPTSACGRGRGKGAVQYPSAASLVCFGPCVDTPPRTNCVPSDCVPSGLARRPSTPAPCGNGQPGAGGRRPSESSAPAAG